MGKVFALLLGFFLGFLFISSLRIFNVLPSNIGKVYNKYERVEQTQMYRAPLYVNEKNTWQHLYYTKSPTIFDGINFFSPVPRTGDLLFDGPLIIEPISTIDYNESYCE
jgi:hypothetical protein